MDYNSRISNSKRIKDWIHLRSKIDENPNDITNWEIAFDQFFMKRVESRYFEPINALKQNICGAGFAIVTIQCSLIEFLETTITGEVYKHSNPDLDKFEYNNSGEKFKNFLITRFPFNTIFDAELANGFYVNVRNGLVHAAQTSNNWLIRMDNKKDLIEISAEGMMIFDRSKFQSLLLIFFKKYRSKFCENTDLQNALRRKLNFICRLPLLD